MQAEDPAGGSEALEGGRATNWKEPGPLKNILKGCLLNTLTRMVSGQEVNFCWVKSLKHSD